MKIVQQILMYESSRLYSKKICISFKMTDLHNYKHSLSFRAISYISSCSS